MNATTKPKASASAAPAPTTATPAKPLPPTAEANKIVAKPVVAPKMAKPAKATVKTAPAATEAKVAQTKAAAPAKAPVKVKASKPLAAPKAEAKHAVAPKVAVESVVTPNVEVKAVVASPVAVEPVAIPKAEVKPLPVVEHPKMAAAAPPPPASRPVPPKVAPAIPAEGLSSYQDALDLSKVTVEAMVQSSTAFARGVQDMGKEVISFAQASIEDTVAASKAIFAVKTIKELIDLQSSFARQSLDRLVADTGKLSECGVKLAEETFAPINAGITVAVDKLAKRAA